MELYTWRDIDRKNLHKPMVTMMVLWNTVSTSGSLKPSSSCLFQADVFSCEPVNKRPQSVRRRGENVSPVRPVQQVINSNLMYDDKFTFILN